MARGKSRGLWQHTSSVLAILANVHRDPRRTKAFKPSDFDPTTTRRRRGGGIGREQFISAIVAEARRHGA